MDLGSGIRDQGSGQNLFRIPDPGVKKAPDPESGYVTLIKVRIFKFRVSVGYRDILVRIRMRIRNFGSVHLNNGAGCGSGTREVIKKSQTATLLRV